MFTCKLCAGHYPDEQHSSADARMCKRCYSDVIKYRRLLERPHLEPHLVAFMKRMERTFLESHERGGFVPKAFFIDTKPINCKRCGESFKTVKLQGICPECYKKEMAYRSLHRQCPTSPRLVAHENYYLDLYMAGKPVPKLFIDRHNCNK